MATEQTDRQLLDQALSEYTAKGWRIVSQAESGFQVAQPKKLNPLGMGLFVILPTVIGCVALLIASAYGIGLLIIAGVGLLLVLADYAVKKETLLYVTADQLRTATARIVPNGSGGYQCSQCGTSVTQDAKTCPQCKRRLVVSAAVYAGLKQ